MKNSSYSAKPREIGTGHDVVLAELAVESLRDDLGVRGALQSGLLGRAVREKITTLELLRERLLLKAGARSADRDARDWAATSP